MVAHGKVVLAVFLVLIGVVGMVYGGELYSQGYNLITGMAASSVFIGYFYDSTCIVTFEPGWNLVSIGCEAYNMSVEEVFMTVNDSVLSVHTFNRDYPEDLWKAYNPYLPDWVVQDLTEISTHKGYWVNMDENNTLEFNGSLKYPQQIN